jgi:hypothetical protein
MGTMASCGIMLKRAGLWEGIKWKVRSVKLTVAVVWGVMPCSEVDVSNTL